MLFEMSPGRTLVAETAAHEAAAGTAAGAAAAVAVGVAAAAVAAASRFAFAVENNSFAACKKLAAAAEHSRHTWAQLGIYKLEHPQMDCS